MAGNAVIFAENPALKNPINIVAVGSVSALGSDPEKIWNNYRNDEHFIRSLSFNGNTALAASIPEDLKAQIRSLRNSVSQYKHLDESVLYSIMAARKAVENAGWRSGEEIGVNIGSSRGATGLFEKYHEEFLRTGKARTLASPATTLGNISSWVAQDLQSDGPQISHSVTCSTGLHSVLNGIAWLEAGMATKFLAGGSEAALTSFTISQMQAMKIYSREEGRYPCKALKLDKRRNSMVLGEGAAVVCLEKSNSERAVARILGVGFAAEKVKHSVSISDEGIGFQKAMKMAMGEIPASGIDAIVMHAPGTIKGDLAEVNAIRSVFKDTPPALTSNKWKIGHTFGASGVLSLELAIMMLRNQEFIRVPFSDESRSPCRLEKILVNAIGFGGNVVSILIGK